MRLWLIFAAAHAASDLCRSWNETRAPWSETRQLPCTTSNQACGGAEDPLSGHLEDAWFSRGDTARLDRFLRGLAHPLSRASSGESGRVAYVAPHDAKGGREAELDDARPAIVVLGGSMTAGTNAASPWPERLGAWLARAYPRARVDVHNWAQGSSGSGIALAQVVPRLAGLRDRLKLVIVDFGVNDAHYGATEVVIATEKIVDRVLALPAAPALVYTSRRSRRRLGDEAEAPSLAQGTSRRSASAATRPTRSSTASSTAPRSSASCSARRCTTCRTRTRSRPCRSACRWSATATSRGRGSTRRASRPCSKGAASPRSGRARSTRAR